MRHHDNPLDHTRPGPTGVLVGPSPDVVYYAGPGVRAIYRGTLAGSPGEHVLWVDAPTERQARTFLGDLLRRSGADSLTVNAALRCVARVRSLDLDALIIAGEALASYVESDYTSTTSPSHPALDVWRKALATLRQHEVDA
jgi:hypothetical protein